MGKKQGRKILAFPGPVHSLNSRGCHYLIKKGAELVENFNDVLRELSLPQLIRAGFFEKAEDSEEQLILGALKEGALEIDKIIEKTNLFPQRVAALLAILEIGGKVRNLE